MVKDIPPDFDWVTVRHRCSLSATFQRLQRQAKNNVDVRNGLTKQRETDAGFGIEWSGNSFKVFDQGASLKAVEFTLANDAILVKGNGGVGVDFRATLTITDDGECRLKVNGAELAEWQVLKRALEDLFFGA
jgi:hypothetical protein